MPVKFSDLVNKTKTITVSLGDMSIEIEYKINFFSPNLRKRIADAEDAASVQNELLAEAIVKWDLVDDKGVMIPVEASVLDNLGIWVSNAIFESMIESARPNTEAPTTKTES